MMMRIATLMIVAFPLCSCSSDSDGYVADAAAAVAGCDPNFSSNVIGKSDFKACDAYAYTAMGYPAIIGNDGKSWITIGFMTKEMGAVVPGTYTITDGANIPAGQGFAVNFVYKEGSSALDHTFASQSGTLDLSVADGSHFRGTFTGSTMRMDGEKDTRELSGSFDVMFDETKSVGKKK